jgi:hypothetical protein
MRGLSGGVFRLFVLSAPKATMSSGAGRHLWSPTNKEEDVGDAAGGDEDENKTQGPAPLELSFNVGVQFGLTDATSDTALKFQGSLSF